MNRFQIMAYHFSRLSLAAIFLYAGVIKATDVIAFAGQVANYQLLPYAWNFFVAAILPYVEILCGVLLLFNKRVRPSLLILLTLNSVFIIALASVMMRGFDIDCGCFNPDSNNPTPPIAAIMRDFVFVLLILTAWFFKPESVENEDD
jgi:putative oxidoreductase